MKARSAKAKGTRLEQHIAKRLRQTGLDKKAGRMPLSGAVSGFKSDISTSLPILIEAKNQERWQPIDYMEQAEQGTEDNNKMPVVIMSKNRQPDPYVMMKLEDWLVIMQRAFIENKMPVTVGKGSYSKQSQLKKG